MRFMMLVKATKDFEAGVWPDEKLLSEMAKWTEELVKAGARLESGRLQPSSTGVRVRYANGKFTVTDGPFAESKELIAGFCLIQAKSRDEAIEWAKRVPFQEGEIELRPLYELFDFPVDPAEKPDGWREKEEQFRRLTPRCALAERASARSVPSSSSRTSVRARRSNAFARWERGRSRRDRCPRMRNMGLTGGSNLCSPVSLGPAEPHLALGAQGHQGH